MERSCKSKVGKETKRGSSGEREKIEKKRTKGREPGICSGVCGIAVVVAVGKKGKL